MQFQWRPGSSEQIPLHNPSSRGSVSPTTMAFLAFAMAFSAPLVGLLMSGTQLELLSGGLQWTQDGLKTELGWPEMTLGPGWSQTEVKRVGLVIVVYWLSNDMCGLLEESGRASGKMNQPNLSWLSQLTWLPSDYFSCSQTHSGVPFNIKQPWSKSKSRLNKDFF